MTDRKKRNDSITTLHVRLGGNDEFGGWDLPPPTPLKTNAPWDQRLWENFNQGQLFTILKLLGRRNLV